MKECKYINFEEFADTGKTKKYYVITKEHPSCLGQIKWYSNWRSYAFFPYTDTLYEEQCLKDIAEFLQYLKEERKIARKVKK